MSEYALPLDKLIPALIKFQAECPAIPKDKENPFFKNKDTGKKAMYADLATIIEIVKVPLSNNGLCVTQPVHGEILETYLYHVSGQFIKSEMKINNEKNNAQGFGSGLTYARRYALSSILGITADEDDDGNGASANNNANLQNTQSKAKPAQPVELKFKINLGSKEAPNYKMLTLDQVPAEQLKQIEWYAANSQNAQQKAAAVAYLAKLNES